VKRRISLGRIFFTLGTDPSPLALDDPLFVQDLNGEIYIFTEQVCRQ
jgi:hypothetical protein